jgi:hypothetical protein
MTSERLITGTVPTLVGMAVVSRVADNALGRRKSGAGRNSQDSRRPTTARRTSGRPAGRTGRPSGGSKGGVGGGFVPAVHYPATKTLTLCGRKLKDTKHTRIRKNVDCKKCKAILRTMGRR